VPAPTFILPGDYDLGYVQYALAGTVDPSAIVPATRRIPARPTITPRRDMHIPDILTGDLEPAYRIKKQGEWVDWSLDMDLYLNDLPIFLHSVMCAPVTTVVVAATAYKHVFKTSALTARRFLLCEYNDGQITWLLTYAGLRSLNFAWSEAGAIRCRMAGFAQRLQTGTATGSLLLGSEDPYEGWEKAWYSDAAGATPGTTNWLDTAYAGDFTIDNRSELIFNKDNNNTYGKISRHRYQAGGTLSVLDTVGVDGGAAPIKFTEYTNETDEVNRIRFTGPLITGSTYYTFDFDFCGRWGGYGRQPFKGATAAQLTWTPKRDAVLGYSAAFTFVNTVASYG
jgi:hypothetical protein